MRRPTEDGQEVPGGSHVAITVRSTLATITARARCWPLV
jgi:hypothetical protein